MKIEWKERLKDRNDPKRLQKYFELYHIPCEESAIDFINRFCFTYDPRLKTDKVLPLELFEKQEDYVRWLWSMYRKDECGVVDKCRTAGASWVTMAFFVYLFLFQKSVSLCAYTYKADECHKLGDISTLLQKCVFIIEKVPALFKQGVTTSHMYLKNSRLSCDIAGSSGDNPGRGGRRTMIMTDEEAFYQRSELIEAALSETSNCRISVSTHSGTNTLFYRKCNSGMNKFVFDWWDDPRNSQEWYDTKKQNAIDNGLLHIFKREIERDAAASIDNVVVPSEWVNSAKRCEIIKDGKRIASLDPRNEGGDLHGFVIADGNCPIYAEESGVGDPGDATDLFFWKAVDYKCDEFRYDPIGVGAGVKVQIKNILSAVEFDNNVSEEKKKIIREMKIIPWSASGKVIRPKEEDFEGITNGAYFENAKAQAWWKVREEFRNTYRFVNDKSYDDNQLISFKDMPESNALNKLILEISQPQFKTSNSGKLMIDKKPKGSESPNCGDAWTMARAEIEAEWIPWE